MAFWLHHRCRQNHLFFPFFAGSFGFCRWCCSHLSFWENYASGFSAGLSNKVCFSFFRSVFVFKTEWKHGQYSIKKSVNVLFLCIFSLVNYIEVFTWAMCPTLRLLGATVKFSFEIFSLSFANTVVLPFFDVIVLNVAPAQGLFTAGFSGKWGVKIISEIKNSM